VTAVADAAAYCIVAGDADTRASVVLGKAIEEEEEDDEEEEEEEEDDDDDDDDDEEEEEESTGVGVLATGEGCEEFERVADQGERAVPPLSPFRLLPSTDDDAEGTGSAEETQNADDADDTADADTDAVAASINSIARVASLSDSGCDTAVGAPPACTSARPANTFSALLSAADTMPRC
jgi:hypothetical protein